MKFTGSFVLELPTVKCVSNTTGRSYDDTNNVQFRMAYGTCQSPWAGRAILFARSFLISFPLHRCCILSDLERSSAHCHHLRFRCSVHTQHELQTRSVCQKINTNGSLSGRARIGVIQRRYPTDWSSSASAPKLRSFLLKVSSRTHGNMISTIWNKSVYVCVKHTIKGMRVSSVRIWISFMPFGTGAVQCQSIRFAVGRN